MSLQSTVRFSPVTGVPGEMAFDGPHRAESGTLSTAAVIGTVVSQAPATRKWGQGAVTGATRLGILANPKDTVLRGTAGNPLAPSFTLPAESQGSVVTMGQIWVTATNANAATGDVVYFDKTTGVITTTAPGAASPGATFALFPGAWVAPLPAGDTAPGLIVLTINGAALAAPL